MKELYLLSGLGADRRVFNYLDLSGFNIHHVEWIAPEPDEAISQYARRLLPQIKTPKPVLVGVSFGGVMATEIGKLIETESIILISSLKTRNDLPLLVRVMGFLKIHRLLPLTKMNRSHRITCLLFGAETKSEQDLLKIIIRETDEQFLRWGVDKILTWKNRTALKNVTLIHGTHDRILPFRSGDYPISGGGHFMIVNRAGEISKLVRELI